MKFSICVPKAKSVGIKIREYLHTECRKVIRTFFTIVTLNEGQGQYKVITFVKVYCLYTCPQYEVSRWQNVGGVGFTVEEIFFRFLTAVTFSEGQGQKWNLTKKEKNVLYHVCKNERSSMYGFRSILFTKKVEIRIIITRFDHDQSTGFP